MANVFLPIPAPIGDGIGTNVDVSAFGVLKTVTVNGIFSSIITIEVSGDGVNFAPLARFDRPGNQVTDRVVAQFIRVKVSNFISGLPIVNIGGDAVTGIIFTPLPSPAGTGVGAAVDVSKLGLVKTFFIGGTFQSRVSVELSEDAAITFIPFAILDAPNNFVVFEGAARFARVRVSNFVSGVPAIILAGSVPEGGTGADAIVTENSILANQVFR